MLLPCRNDDYGLEAEEAGGHGDALAVVAACGGDQAGEIGLGLLEPCGVDQGAAQLECAGRRVVFMLDPRFGAEPLIEERPRVLRRGRHVAIDQTLRFVNLLE